MEYYSAIKKNAFESVLMRWMKLEPIQFSSIQFSRSVIPASASPWTVAHQTPQCMGFSRKEYWSGLPCPPLGDLPDPAIEPTSPASPALQADFLPLTQWGKP